MLKSPISNHAFDVDLLDVIATDIAVHHKSQWPLLHNVIVLLPNYQHAAKLQNKVLAAGNTQAIAGLQIHSFKDYINNTAPLEQQSIPQDARELILMEALQAHGDLFGQHNPLTTAYALLELFDVLTRRQISLPEDIDEFIAQLQRAYQTQNDQKRSLSNEAQIVHTLWFAWHQQLQAIDCLDKESQYQLKLAKNLALESGNSYYIAGFHDFLPAEIEWINGRLAEDHAYLYFQTEIQTDALETRLGPSNLIHRSINVPSNNNANRLYHAVFNSTQDHFTSRAKQAQSTLHPVSDRLSTFTAKSFEEEAQAITLQIRLWLAQNKFRLALILEDRRLARRVRALLQRSGIGMRDSEGWALSTTATAAVVESWLQCIEENFHCTPLIDLLKSPFAFTQDDMHTQRVYRFEQDLVIRENISRDLQRYQTQWASRQKALGQGCDEISENLTSLFKHLSLAAEPLKKLNETTKASLSDYLQALKTSLLTLGIHDQLTTDDAGIAILTLLDTLTQAATHSHITLDWVSFRHWFGLKLEQNNFSPANPFTHSVELFHLSQTTLGHYDAIIIGSMTREQFPSATKQTPFFNQSVRQELGLNPLVSESHLKFCYFRRLLESAPQVLLSYHFGPQESLPSPWLELLSRFHQLAFSKDLENRTLHQLLLQHTLTNILPAKTPEPYSAPTIPANLLPESLSASAHQSLIQCPYAFFAGQILKLRASEEVSEKLSKSDYGERIHLCLQAFHAGDVSHLDGPFLGAITENNKTDAVTLLTTISEQVFANDLEDNFRHRGWLKRWLNIIPAYIDWQVERETHWRFSSGEIKSSNFLSPGINVHGRIDRIDQAADDISIIDYKTGSVPNIQELRNGEAIQLIHYALSHPKAVSRVEYLQFGGNTKDVTEKCTIEHDELTHLADETRTRLMNMYHVIQEGKALPAWGDEKICRYCEFGGLCRHKLR